MSELKFFATRLQEEVSALFLVTCRVCGMRMPMNEYICGLSGHVFRCDICNRSLQLPYSAEIRLATPPSMDHEARLLELDDTTIEYFGPIDPKAPVPGIGALILHRIESSIAATLSAERKIMWISISYSAFEVIQDHLTYPTGSRDGGARKEYKQWQVTTQPHQHEAFIVWIMGPDREPIKFDEGATAP